MPSTSALLIGTGQADDAAVQRFRRINTVCPKSPTLPKGPVAFFSKALIGFIFLVRIHSSHERRFAEFQGSRALGFQLSVCGSKALHLRFYK